MQIEILHHTIEIWFRDWEEYSLSELDKEHIQEKIIDWYVEWEFEVWDNPDALTSCSWHIEFKKDLETELDKILVEIKEKLDSTKSYIEEWYSDIVRQVWWTDSFEELVENEWEYSDEEEVARQVWKAQVLQDLYDFITNLR